MVLVNSHAIMLQRSLFYTAVTRAKRKVILVQMDIEDDATYDVTLKRAVGKFRLVVKDETPKTIKQMKIYYTGGSSTFDATTGYGCVNSFA